MNQKTAYTGIDYFRLLAAFLIVAIHTSPLTSYSMSADFILTRILARVAVPFFFMTSGFFLLSGWSLSVKKLTNFLKKNLLLYLVAIMVYIPLNIYNGYFSADYFLPNLIKDLIFDGTTYHLWYLPAAIIGAAISYLLIKKLGFKWAFVIAAFLYIIGLFGDSYYGVAEQIPLFKSFYQSLFSVSDYSRNGIFFAPIFFILGGILAKKPVTLSLKRSLVGLAITLPLLLGEGLLLHMLDLQRHDSMYFMLIPLLFFLFSALTFWRGQRNPACRTATMIIYIAHPMMIVAVRMVAKILGLEFLLIQNSVLHFFAVSLFSVLAAVFLPCLFSLLKKHRKSKGSINATPAPERSWIELDYTNLAHNVTELRKNMPTDCELMAIIKAEAYGHGSIPIAGCLHKIGVTAFGVATIEEGILLRENGISGTILIMGYTSPTRVAELHQYELTQTIISHEHALALDAQKIKIKAHIKIDTGMHRLGYDLKEPEHVIRAFQSNYLDICGIYTHLCASDSLFPADVDFTQQQLNTFHDFLEKLVNSGIQLPKIHVQSSYGLLNYPEVECDYVRCGIALFGVRSHHRQTNLQIDLHPVLSLKSRVILIRAIREGETVGYGRDFVAENDCILAILPIGYGDGFPRDLSNGRAEVLLHGVRAPIIGRICMDQLIIDITEIPDVALGDIVTLIGTDGIHTIHAVDLAENAGTITNELLSRLGCRLIRSESN